MTAAEDVVARELRLLDPAVRRDPVVLTALLHPDFAEFGRSGRVWDRASVAADLADPAGGPEPVITASDLLPVVLAEDVVLLTWTATAGDQVSRRSSVWVRRDGEWLLRFAQGTAVPPG